MSQQNRQKIKLLKLYEMLRQETDEQNPLTTNKLCGRLAEQGITCDRRTLAGDIALLNEYGYEVMSRQLGREKAYYIEERSFSIPELKIMLDAVQAASFITSGKTDDLIDKISALGGSHRGEILKGNMVCFNTRKHSNEAIYYAVGFLEEAIQNKKKVSFRYFDLNEDGDRAFRKNKERYIAEPMALIFYEDNYYLVCFCAEHEDMRTTYRVDRMDKVSVEADGISSAALVAIENADMAEYTEQAFKMYGGTLQDIILHFDDALMNAVYDKFGEDTHMERISEETVSANVRVQVSPMFFGWVFQFEGRVSIASPENVIEEYKKHIEAVCSST